MLLDEITSAQRLVRTDAYQMSLGEIVGMYEKEEIIIEPDFQRLFRWNDSQKSKLIESLLLGIPLPPIFVFEKEDGRWELIDGLQRISTVLEFMGALRRPPNGTQPPSILEATKYLPSLHNAVWERSELITDTPLEDQRPLEKALKLSIRRARIGVEILKRPSDDQTKYDLFQRLNAGGTQANAQELRNCIMIMVNKGFFKEIQTAADNSTFQQIIAVNEEQIERQRHMEYAVRFLVLTSKEYDGTLDVEEYIDDGIVALAKENHGPLMTSLLVETFELLNAAAGRDALKRFENGHFLGKVGLVALEGIAVGIAKNLREIKAMASPVEFARRKIEGFWSQPQTASFTSPGLRGTTRIQRTVPFGEVWFRP